MKRAKILSLVISSVISLAILLALPFFFQSSSFVANAQYCSDVKGRCVPQEYNCVDGRDSPLPCGGIRQKCYIGGTCTAPTGPTAGCPDGSINTALGCFGIRDPNVFIIYVLRTGIGLGGGLAFILMVYAGFMVMTSSGDPRRLTAGKELLTAAIAGLLFLVGGTYILRLIGVDLLGIF